MVLCTIYYDTYLLVLVSYKLKLVTPVDLRNIAETHFTFMLTQLGNRQNSSQWL